MIKFSQYLSEAVASAEQVMKDVEQYKKADEILNPDYKRLTDNVKRAFEADSRSVKSTIMDEFNSPENKADEDVSDVYYSWPWDSISSITSFEKKVAKIEKKPWAKKIVKTAKELIAKWKQTAVDLKDMKSKVVKVSAKRDQAKQAAAIASKKKADDSSTLIKLLESHMEEYKEVARKKSAEFVQSMLDRLEKAGWDLNKIAPRPSTGVGKAAYMAASAKRQLYDTITTPATKSRFIPHGNDPDIRVTNKQAVDRYIENDVQTAEDNYREFIHKMVEKIGKPVVKAKLTGSIWTSALLTVETNDGEEQVWDTQVIINFSKYQKMFNQFPTRRKK